MSQRWRWIRKNEMEKNYTLSGSEEKDGEFHATHLSKVKRKLYKYYSRKPHKHMPT